MKKCKCRICNLVFYGTPGEWRWCACGRGDFNKLDDNQEEFFVGRDQDGNSYIVPRSMEKVFDKAVEDGGRLFSFESIKDFDRVYFTSYTVE